MKLLSLFTIFGLWPVLCFSQQSDALNETPSEANSLNIELYELDYELIDYSFINGDSTILNALNIDGMLLHRKTNTDIVMTDLEHGVKILIYSEARAKAERNLSSKKPSINKRAGQ